MLSTRLFFLLRPLLPLVALLLPTLSLAQKQPLTVKPGNQLTPPRTAPTGPPLTLEEAIRTGLENNYGIRIAKRDELIASNNVTRGNAGQLPSIDGNFTRTFNINNSRQEIGGQEPRIVNGGRNNALGANVGLSWTIFDGLGMFIAYDRLQALERRQQQATRATVEQTVFDIMNAYFTVVRESGKIRAFEEALQVGQARIDLTQARVDVGVTAKVELLTAQVDFNADRAQLIQQREALATAKVNLNNVLGRSPQAEFSPADSIVVDGNLQHDAVVQGILAQNPQLQQARLNIDVANYERRLVRASRYPQVALGGGYGLTRNINNNFILNSRSGDQITSTVTTNANRVFGPNYGVSVSVPIFDGFNRNRLEQNARIATEQSQLQLEQTQLDLNAQAEQAFLQYQNRLQLLQLEEDNIKLARQNVEIALERYRLGLLTPLALREAQRNQLNAEARLLDARFAAKQAETVLRQLSGGLVQEAPQAK